MALLEVDDLRTHFFTRDGVVRAARDADLFLCEASFVHGEDNPPDLHLTGREAGEVATAAGVRALAVTHIPPWHDADAILAEAAVTYSGPLHRAVAGQVFEL